MTKNQQEICIGLGNVRYLPGSWDKRMGQNLYGIASSRPTKELSDSQNEWMYRLLYNYRKQLPALYNKYKSIPYCSKKEKRSHYID